MRVHPSLFLTWWVFLILQVSPKAHTGLFDKPAYIDAVANIGGTINDREYFVRSLVMLNHSLLQLIYCFIARESPDLDG
jgi:hypothetical protein